MTAVTVGLSLLLLQAPRDGVVPRAAPAAPQGTAAIRGQVTAVDTGQPLRRAVVMLSGHVVDTRGGGGAGAPRRFITRSVKTNSAGRFEFTRLPAGSYRLHATGGPHRSHYLAMNYAARSPIDIGKALELADGQSVQTQFALPRGGTVSGRVLDDTGEPVSEVTVGALRVSQSGTYQAVGQSDQTDDQGRFRIYSLQPGEYVVSAEARDHGPQAEGRSEGFAATYFPSAVSEHEATRVRVAPELQAADLEIVLVRTPTFRISGSLLDSTGAAVTRANAVLMRAVGSGHTFGGGVSLSDDGGFSVRDVIAGNYVLSVRPAYDPDAPPNAMRPRREFAIVPLSVDADVEDLVVTTQPGTTITGRVSFAEGVPTVPPKLTVMTQTPDRLPSVGSTPQAAVGSDLRFTLTDLFGHYTVRPVGLPDGYTLKAVLLGATDITSVDVEFKPEHNGQLVIVLTNRTSVIDGAVADANGRPASEVSIVLLPEDKSSWRWGNMRTRVTTASDGTYRLEGILPGRYHLVAVPRDRLRPSRADGLTVFEPFLSGATTVVVGEDERRTVDLRVTTKD